VGSIKEYAADQHGGSRGSGMNRISSRPISGLRGTGALDELKRRLRDGWLPAFIAKCETELGHVHAAEECSFDAELRFPSVRLRWSGAHPSSNVISIGHGGSQGPGVRFVSSTSSEVRTERHEMDRVDWSTC
jgi:hypothetical protein